MRRREFITLVGGAAVALPLIARAQQQGRLPTIGFLGASTASNWTHRTAAFVNRLRELGWTEGRTVAIEYRWAESRTENFTVIADEFVRLKVDVILTVGNAANAAQQVTKTIPIVAAIATDPVGTGMVASLARPGGNLTGLSIQSADTAGKRIELFREFLPGLRRLAIIGNADYAAGHIAEAQAAEQTFGAVYTDKPGQPPLPTRLMAGLAILKHTYDLSDEALCDRWVENPYFQYFCGEEFFQHALVFDRSSLTRWRQRMGAREAQGTAAGELGGGDPDGRDEALRPRLCCDRYDGAAEGGDVSDRRQAAQPGARAAGASG